MYVMFAPGMCEASAVNMLQRNMTIPKINGEIFFIIGLLSEYKVSVIIWKSDNKIVKCATINNKFVEFF